MYCNGIPVIVPNTSLSTIFSQTPGYIDPLDPGSCTKPNIAATRGIHEPGLPGGLLTTPRIDADMTIEYTPQTKSLTKSVFGVQVQNLFNQLYNVPIVNGCYGIPVTTGLTSGSAPCTYSTPQYAPPDVTAHSNAPYLTYPNETPIYVSPLLPGDHMMQRWSRVAAIAALPASLVACGNGGSSEPPMTSVDPAASSKMQLAVGVATMAFNCGTERCVRP